MPGAGNPRKKAGALVHQATGTVTARSSRRAKRRYSREAEAEADRADRDYYSTLPANMWGKDDVQRAIRNGYKRYIPKAVKRKYKVR